MSEDLGSCEGGVCVPHGKKDATANSEATPFDPAAPDAESKSDKTTIHIDIISDTMCPWCFVGKRGLEEALQRSPDIDVKVNWLPYFLDKTLPEEGKPVKEYFRRNYGDPDAGDRMMPHLVDAGKRCGIDFETHHVGIDRYRPTIRSHRLIEYAKEQGKQDAMVEELFHMYYEEGKHLNSIEHLCDSAKKVGLEGDVEAFLKGTRFEAEIFQEAGAIKYKAHGVPTFFFSRADQPNAKPLTFSGGQPPASFVRVFKHLQKEGKR